jgi:transcriptional regulator with XRE-family HTH domain
MSVTIQLNDDVFPANMIYLRKKRKVSQLSLANQSGVSVHYLRGVEKGCLSSRFCMEDYMNICKALQASPTAMGTVRLDGSEQKKEMTLD